MDSPWNPVQTQVDHSNWRTFPDPLLVPNHHFGHSTWPRQNKAILWPDSRSPWKMGPGTSRTVQTKGVKFQTAGFLWDFVLSCLIRKGTNLGPPDLESSQKAASGDTHIVHFGPHPIWPQNPPPPYPIGHITTLQPPCYCNRHCNAVRGNSKGTL